MNPEEKEKTAVDDGLLSLTSLDLELAPAWARKSPEAHHRRFAEDERGGMDEPRRFGGVRDRRQPFRGGPARDNSRDNPRDNPRGNPRRDSGPARPDRGPARFEPRRPDAGRSEDRRDFRPAPVRPPEPVALPPLEIRVLPDQKALGGIIRKIQTTHRAYPLRDIARLFLDNDASYQLRVEPVKGETVPLFQCKVCGLPALSEQEIRTHILSTHLGDFFTVEEVETDPPAGNFTCVARCGLSGEWLGPPNHHSFSTRVQEMLRTRFAHMGAEAYRARIEMVRDPEAINQWRESCRKKKIYRLKRAESPAPAPAAEPADPAAAIPPAALPEEVPSPALDKSVAEGIFEREILPAQILSQKPLICPTAAARRTPSRLLLESFRETMNREARFPASLFFALRGAFRHRSLHLFRVNQERGPDFVMVREPVALDATHVVSELRQVLTYINEHPGCTRQELLDSLSGGDAAQGMRLATQLNTLVEKAHVIEFYNGVLCPPMEFPVFKHTAAERNGQKADNRSPKPASGNAEPAAAPAPPAAAPDAPPPESSAVPEPESATDSPTPAPETADCPSA